jgi:Mrp family chromosome partitioning ATPase
MGAPCAVAPRAHGLLLLRVSPAVSALTISGGGRTARAYDARTLRPDDGDVANEVPLRSSRSQSKRNVAEPSPYRAAARARADGSTRMNREDVVCGTVENGDSPPTHPSDAKGFRAIAVVSGKGGVGKTNVVANLAAALQRRGQRVIVIDADLGLGNLGTLLGVNPRATLRDVLHGQCPIQDILVSAAGGISLVPAASGFGT